MKNEEGDLGLRIGLWKDMYIFKLPAYFYTFIQGLKYFHNYPIIAFESIL